MYFSKISTTFPGHFPVFHFLQDFSRPGNLLFNFPGFQGFPGAWEPRVNFSAKENRSLSW